MISILCPTRERPKELRRMINSAWITSRLNPKPEVVLYIDYDDKVSVPIAKELNVKYMVGPRITLTQCWNECYHISTGDIVMQGNDDVIFQTDGWDKVIEDEFKKYEDKIVMVHGSDEGMHFSNFGPHPFVHRRWVDTLGYFIPPYFSCDYGDAWVNYIANSLNRRVYVSIIIEHMHFLFGKAEKDQNTLDRLGRGEKDNNDAIWASTSEQRYADARKLGYIMSPQFMPTRSEGQPAKNMGFIPGHLNHP